MSAITVTRSRFNIIGSSGGTPNSIVYFGPTLDMTALDSPITSTNTLKVWRYTEAGVLQSYVPGGGGNDFTSLDAGLLGLGRGYVIIAKSDFSMPYCFPG